MERLTKRDTDGQAMMDCEKCNADWTGKHGKPMVDCTALYCRNRLKDRLAAYEDTGLTPEDCARATEIDDILLDEYYPIGRVRELIKADKDGRVVVLPCKVGDTVIDQTFAETPRLMKNTRLEIAYESRCGIIFHMGYDIFADLVEHGRIKPVSEEAEKALEAIKDE